MGYQVNRIDLGKMENDSDYWVSNVNDAKLQEIADALGMKLNTVKSGSRWILYSGDDTYNTTGIVVYIDGDYVFFRTICKNVCSEDFYMQQQVSLYRNNTDTDAKNAELFYVKCKNAVVFGIANSYKADSNMVFIVMDAADIRDDREYVIYACPAVSSALCYINCDTNVRTDYNFSYRSTQDDFVMLIPWIIGSEYLMAKNAYAMRYGKWIAAMYYSFECNGKNYFVPNSVAASYRIALELPDE